MKQIDRTARATSVGLIISYGTLLLLLIALSGSGYELAIAATVAITGICIGAIAIQRNRHASRAVLGVAGLLCIPAIASVGLPLLLSVCLATAAVERRRPATTD